MAEAERPRPRKRKVKVKESQRNRTPISPVKELEEKDGHVENGLRDLETVSSGEKIVDDFHLGPEHSGKEKPLHTVKCDTGQESIENRENASTYPESDTKDEFKRLSCQNGEPEKQVQGQDVVGKNIETVYSDEETADVFELAYDNLSNETLQPDDAGHESKDGKQNEFVSDDNQNDESEKQIQVDIDKNVETFYSDEETADVFELASDDLYKEKTASADIGLESKLSIENKPEIPNSGNLTNLKDTTEQSNLPANEPEGQVQVINDVAVKENQNYIESQIQNDNSTLVVNSLSGKEESEIQDPGNVRNKNSSPRPASLGLHATALKDGPAVIEDPDTPMARATSPPVSKTVIEETKPPLPSVADAIVKEEKSPHLLAEEAFARMQILAENLAAKNSSSCEEQVPSEKVKSEKSKEEHKAAHPKLKKEKLSVLDVDKNKVTAVVGEKEASKQTTTTSIITTEPTRPTLEVPKTKIRAMSLSELLEQYQNPQLAYNQQFVEDFIQNEMKKEGHEFYEILSNYLRAKLKLGNVEEEIRLLQTNYNSLQESLWVTSTKSVVVQGECGDKSKVTTSHTYEQCQLDPDAVKNMEEVLKDIRKKITDDLSLFAYSAMISKLQVESYIHDFYTHSPLLRDIPKNAPVQAQKQYQVDNEGMRQIQKLKDCISILFIFHRKPVADTEFVNNIRSWTTRLVSTLLRVATFREHLFILNHLLRCPSGVGKWAAELFQFTKISPTSGHFQSSFSNDILDHVITALSTILLPVRAREEFLNQMKVSMTQESIQDEKTWILVDSDGEELQFKRLEELLRQSKRKCLNFSIGDEEPSNAWLYLHENDIVAILNQFSLSDLFSHILLSTVSDSGQVDYDIRRCTEPIMIKLLSFATVLVQLLGAGLRTYNMVRYRQLNKRIGRLIRHTVCFVSDHWLNFKNHYGPMTTNASMDTLQMEFDQLFMRATYCILTAEKLGSWQFMADMPYTCVSEGSMWQLLWVLHQVQGQVLNLDFLPPAPECKAYVQDPDSWQQLADNLTHMPTSEAFFLMTTFANMACCRSYSEQDFVQTVTYEVFQIAYISTHTRDFCSKVGRELLSTIIQTHPNALSFLLARVREVMTKLGKMALYLFSELPISIWQPTDPDMLILRQWLLNFSLTFVENNLARIILSKINWDVFEQTGRPVVDLRLHRQTALLLVESYTRYISEKRAGFFISEGMKQMASYMTSTLSPEQIFNNWAWDLALKLKLHQQSVVWHAASNAVDPSFRPPQLSQETSLLPVFNGAANKIPIACFIALSMTDVGHDITTIMRDGLDMLKELASSGQYTTTIHILGCIVPLFLECQQYLLDSERFQHVLQCLVVADESLLKSTKSTVMTVEFPGLVIKQFNEMIQAQISSHLIQGKANLFLTFWVKAIFKVSRWFNDRNCCYIANSLIQWCFVTKGVTELFMKIIMEFHTRQPKCDVGSDELDFYLRKFQSVLLGQSSDFRIPWLAFIIMSVEGEIEMTSGLWRIIQMNLHSNPKMSVDSALKSAVSSLNIQPPPTPHKLLIYRWAKQALDTPIDHPLLPVIWQRFFVLYLGRLASQNSMGQRASVGERFFESLSFSSLLKRMRRSLKETSDYHLNVDLMKKQGRLESRSANQDEDYMDQGAAGGAPAPSSPGDDDNNMEYNSTKEFHQMLARLYQTFILWVEEPRLHDANLYLPALPLQYEAGRLNQIFQGYLGPWLEFVDTEGIQYTLSCLAADWRNRLTGARSSSSFEMTDRHKMKEPENATKRIEQRLKRYDSPKDAPVINKIQSAVPLISASIIGDKDAFLQLVSSDLELLRQHTQIFSAKNANHCALDDTYIQLVPALYANVSKLVYLTAECRSALNPLHRCSLPASMTVRINEKERNEITFRRIQENRVEYNQLIIELLIRTPLNICVAAVHTENAITCLIKQCQQSTNSSLKQRLCDIGCSLFLHLTSLVSGETNFFPPSKHFFASCIEILGQEFVSHDPSQTDTVLQLCLDNPLVSGMVAPHFVPNSCPDHFVDMYGQLIHVLQDQNMDLGFMLLTKFDLSLWLETYQPKESDRYRLVEILGSSLTACGSSPEAKCSMVFELYVAHLKSLLQSAFPSNLTCVLNMILQGSETRGLHVQVWDTFLSVCFANNPTIPASEFGIENCNEVPLSTAQVKEYLDWMSNYFMRARIQACQNSGVGLYATWTPYVHHISLFLGGLMRSYVAKALRGSEEISNPFHILNTLWTVYAPWIQPMVGDNEALNVPWKEEYREAALHITSSLSKTLEFIYQQISAITPERAPGVLSLVLMYYLTMLSTKSTPRHAMEAYLKAIEGLPWEKLWPDLQLVDAMTKVKENASPCCFLLIGYIMPFVNWKTVIGYHLHHTPPEIASKLQTGVALLLIQCYVDSEVLKRDLIYRLLLQAETFDWSAMTMEGMTCVTSWFLQLSDPACILAERSSKLAIGLRVLKQVCGFTNYIQWHSDLVTKRQMYIHILAQLFCQMTYKDGTSQDSIKTGLVNLMSEIEAVESTVPSVEGQMEESSSLLKSVCGLLNNSNPDGPWLDLILSTLTGWLESSPQSILLAPCMKVASTSLAGLRHMVAVLESCIASYFSGREAVDSTASVPNGWDFILSMFYIPELNPTGFVREALAENAFLVLYSYLRYKVPFCQTWDQNFSLLEEILTTAQKAEPSEDNEMKILLWWHLLLDLLVQQLKLCPLPSVSAINMVNQFIPYLNYVGQERTNKGLLRAIGLGQKSTLSKKMRLMAIVLSSYLQAQLIDSNHLRLDSSTPLPNSSISKELRNLRAAKSYASLSAQCDKAIVFIRDPSHSLSEAPLFVAIMGLELFPDYIYLKHVFA